VDTKHMKHPEHHFVPCVLASLLALACSAFADVETNTIVPAVQPVTARDFYNAGTELLAANKFSQAEQMFESALATQDARVQPPALYNLGDARFSDGLAALKKGPSAQSTSALGNEAGLEAGSAIQRGQEALAGNDLSKLIAAYLDGRGARQDVRAAEAAVRQAIQTYGDTLRKWQQADDDFKSAAELNPADTDAARNAQIVEQYIARLVDSLRQMQRLAGMLASGHKKLDQVLREIGGRIPKPNLPPGAPGDKDQEDGLQPESLQGLKEGATQMGDAMETPLSRDEAAQILNAIPLDAAERLMMNERRTGQPVPASGLTW
jgi:tetratricopeptide (TPR) repeat protein